MPATTGSAVLTLPSDTEILITRGFGAARHLVYRAYTTPELVRRWWAGKRGEVTLAEIDLRVGGMWRYVMIANEGFEVAFHACACGWATRLVCSVSSAVMSFGRVSCGTITSSM